MPATDEELAALYATFCLDAFPDAYRLDRLASRGNARPMTGDQVSALLRNDPGRGWFIRSPAALFAITVEDPPYSTCAVRRMTPSGLSSVKNYRAAVEAYAARRRGQLTTVPPQRAKTPDGGGDVSIYAYQMIDPASGMVETFAVFLTNYHGRVGGIWKADAADGVGVEVRLVHQMVKP